ncbi:MAG: STT3 domain-containing protein [Candidatus Omnitrophica bacterium]|nr:STT3 domain-containing protein [Candidatus Omnitrophota bacterium]
MPRPDRKKIIFFIAPLIFVLSLNIYFRTFTIYFPQLRKTAKNVVRQVAQQMIAQDVYRKFPQFNPLAKDRLIKSRIREYHRQNNRGLRGQIEEGYSKLKDKYQDENGQTYLMELDCWHWARYVDNVIRHGYPGDEKVYGKQLDLFMLAPKGMYLFWDQFLFYFSAFLYKLFSLFTRVPLFTFLFYLPLFFIAVFITCLYLFSLRYCGPAGAALTCLFAGLGPIFLPRSTAGWFDKDILNLLFPLMAAWGYLLSYDGRSRKDKLPWLIFSGFWIGIFCSNWTYWWFIPAIIVIYEFLAIGSLFFRKVYFKADTAYSLKEHSFSLSALLLCGTAWIVLLCGFWPLSDFYKRIRMAFVLNKPLMSSIWPNVYSTVGELRTMNLREIAGSAGGNFIFGLSLACLLIISARVIFDRKYPVFKRRAFIILALWFISMFFASTRGIRFAVFILVPLGVFLGWAINDVYVFLRKSIKLWAAVWYFAVFAVLTFGFMGRARRTAENISPLMNDSWYKVLSIVKEKTPQDTILNSWWDFGDWFKVAAGRRVIFDGQSQDTPQAYWMARALLTNDEKKAIGILRMLNNSGNEAFETIDKHLKDPSQSALLLESIIGYPPKQAQKILLDFLPIPAAEEVMTALFKRPANACFIVDDSMPYKMPAISYLGNWDFTKVYIAHNLRKKEKDQIMEHLKKLGRDTAQMQHFYQEAFLITSGNLDDWLSHRVQFYSGLANGQEKDGVVFFDNNFIYNPKEQTIRSNPGDQVPAALFTLMGNNFTKTTFPKANLGFSALVFKKEGNYKCVLLDTELADSVFTRLYFFNGQGLKHFQPFIEAEEGNKYTRVFNIVW